IRISQRHMDNARRLVSTSRPVSRYQALTPATTKEPVRKDASTIWVNREGNDGLKIACPQLVPPNMTSTSSVPSGVCTQLLAARIQKEEMKVPSATMQAANRCMPGGTLLRPNSSTPRKAASRKKAVTTS